MSRPVSHRLAATLAVATTGVTTLLVGALAPAAVAAPPSQTSLSAHAATASSEWFVDPRSKAERRAEIRVPNRPKNYAGPVAETRAAYRTSTGDLAVPLRFAFGHTVEQGQALTLDGNGLFGVNTTALSDVARSQLEKLAASLSDASAVRCEGYADYTGKREHNRNLARARAARVCDTLAALSPGLVTTSTGFGPDRPAIVGGKSDDRRLNRRVTVQMTGTRPAVTVPPVMPPVVVPPVVEPPVVPPVVVPPVVVPPVVVPPVVVPPVVPPVVVPPVVLPPAPAFQVPGAPVLEHTDGTNGYLYYAFSKPESDGGSPITGYEVSVTGYDWATVPEGQVEKAAGSAPVWLHGVIYDLPVGVPLELRVRAVNAVGAGAPSNSLTEQVVGAPDAPTDLSAAVSGFTVELSFVPPANTGGLDLTGYQVRTDDGAWTTAATSGTSSVTVSLPWQTNGTHEYAVRAANSFGRSPAVSISSVEVVALAQPLWDGSSHRSFYDTVGEFYIVWYSGTVNPATVIGWEVSINNGPWLPTTNTELTGSSALGDSYTGLVNDDGCASTSGSCTSETTGRVRAVTTTGHSEPSDPGPVRYYF